MNRRFKRILMLLLAAALFVPQVLLAPVAAADSSGSTNGNYVLKVETTGGQQYDGAQIDTGASGLNLVAGTAYTFSYDLYTPDQDVAGIILQTNGNYNWIKDTGALSAASPAWTSYTGTYTYLVDSGTKIQFVKKSGAANITYYIDNFVVTDATSGDVVYTAGFEDQTVGGFTQSGTATLSAVATPQAATDYFLKVETKGGQQYDGAQIDTGASGLNLVAGTAYTFSYDLYTPDQDVAGIILQTNGNYNWIKDTGALSAASPAWASYTATYIYLVDSGAQIQFVKKSGAANITYYIDNFVVTDATSGDVVYTADFDDETVGGFTQSGTAALTNVNSIGASTTPTPTPPVSDQVVVAYDLQEDVGLVDLMTNGGTDYLTKAGGPTLTPLSNDDGTVAIEISNRVNSYDGIDVKVGALGLAKDAEYSVELAGHIPDGVTVPSGAKIALGLASDPYTEFQSVDAATDFTLSYEGVWDSGAGLRIQASEGIAAFVIDSLIITVKGGIKMPPKPLPTVPGVHVSLTAKGDSWSGANIILGLDQTQWPFSSSTEGDVVAFTPVKDAKYHLTFNATSTGTNGYRVRWITGNDNGGYTGADAAVVSDAAHSYAAGTVATTLPGSFTSGEIKDKTLDFTVDFVMSGSEAADGLIGNIAIRGTSGSSDFTINSLKITDDNGNVLVQWSNTAAPFVPDDYVWPESKWDLTLPSLKEAYSKYFLIGNILGWGGNAAMTPWGQENDQTDQALKDASIVSQTEAMFKAQYNVVTAENVMKPDNISKAKDTYDYTPADKLIAWATANKIDVVGHTLVWHQQSPAWLNKGSAANRESAKANLESYIANVAGHFKDQVISWDVVNEAFSDTTSNFDGSDWTTGLRKDSPWYMAYANGADASKGESGADYIYDAFVAARLADPNAALYYNDYNETYKYEQIAQMAESLNAKWATDSRNTDQARKLVEGIGMQSHFWVGQDPDVDVTEVETTIQRFIQADLRISVSELDIPFAANNNYHLDEARQAQQAELYGILFGIYKKYADNIDRVTFWGKADIQSWRGSGMPLLFDNSYRPKEAFWKVIGLGAPTTTPPPSNDGYVPPVSSDPKPNADGKVIIEPKVETKNGVTTATVSNNDLTKALDAAPVNAQGKKQVIVEIPAQAGSTSYEVQLPTSSLKDSDTTVLSIKTENGTIDLPGNMFSNTDVGNADKVTIRIAQATTTGLSDAVREQIGDRPVINLEVLVGNSVVAWNNSNAPVTVAIPYTPTAQELNNTDHIVVWYIDGEGKVTSIPNGRYDVASGTVAFQTTHFSTYAVGSVFKTFGDLQNVAWAKQAIEVMAARDVVKGSSANSFSPAASIKRADFIALLIRALELQGTGKNEAMFSDVQNTAYYIHELVIAKELGIITGYGDNTFKPDSAISRQEMMVMTTRALAAAGKKFEVLGTLDAFPDAASISGFAKDSAAALVKSGIVNGKNGKIAPNDSLTRAEAAVILYRIWNLITAK
ncbi:hypothetical protein BK133_07400 [Paenibacillus sp. FSL H8-0548]|uniref:endo-1,4-beta-xylanase n=1 Tax=Paenibacillus sp. FSL H8-0548 TaxID=1920422 RepID=UPI00096BD660|nr:endo-1,4-beta-xylanase [Paenibacillus sp. FSL H8-0548]OMF37028.1 hypothetical protein BK133_07400 [Paenibacillus sp. FSL H8-0548]